jgi:hypothetical protein
MKRFQIHLPNDYEYCASKVNVTSANPQTNPGAPRLQADRETYGVSVQTNTPQQGVGGGGSSVESIFTVVGVHRNEAAAKRTAGACTNAPFKQKIVNCVGYGCGPAPKCDPQDGTDCAHFEDHWLAFKAAIRKPQR